MINYYKIEVLAKSENFTPPFFIGTMLRSAFEEALKKVVCINCAYSCPFCFFNDRCSYFNFFEEKNKTKRYRFDIELKPKDIHFKLFLFEDSIDSIPYILNAITKMFNEVGLGEAKKKFKIKKMLCNEEIIFNGKEFKLKCPPQNFKLNFNYSPKSSNINLRFLTPLRIKENNKVVKTNLKLESILQSIQNRRDDIRGVKNSRLSFVPQFKIENSNVKFLDLSKFSNNQQTKMNLGGFIGEMKISNIDNKSVELLKLGELIGVGKSTAFGLGKIEVEKKD